MRGPLRMGVASSLLSLAVLPDCVCGQQAGPVPPAPPPAAAGAPALEGPRSDLEPIPQDDSRRESAREQLAQADEPWTHDALKAGEEPGRAPKVYAPKAPPAPVAERPAGRRPSGRSVWVPGYWDWDADRGEFSWVAGVWQVPPRSMLWTNGRWMRDQNGWYRVPGYWSPRRGERAQGSPVIATAPPAWQTTGPPAEHPPDNPAPAPGPDYFYVAGHYEPMADGTMLIWKSGFWAREERGWDWVPARWVRRPSGWEYRPGDWVREPEPTDLRATIHAGRPARPTAPGSAPGIGPGAVEIDVDAQPPPVAWRGDDEPGALATLERPEGQSPALRRIVVVPDPGMPYYVIRPPGYYPYGPGGVIVPAVVPRFVRRILNDVLP